MAYEIYAKKNFDLLPEPIREWILAEAARRIQIADYHVAMTELSSYVFVKFQENRWAKYYSVADDCLRQILVKYHPGNN